METVKTSFREINKKTACENLMMSDDKSDFLDTVPAFFAHQKIDHYPDQFVLNISKHKRHRGCLL